VEEKIAYCEQSSDGRNSIVLVNGDGTGRKELTKFGEVRCAVGMPILKRTLDNAKFINFAKISNGKALVRLVGTHSDSVAIETAIGEVIGVPTLSWSPNGEKIAFTSLVGGKPTIAVIGKDGAGLKPVVSGYTTQWSPNGNQILFRHDSETTTPVTSVWIANADGTQPRKLLDNEAAEFGLTWSPNGSSIVFASQRENKDQSEIFRINVDGTSLERVATQPQISLSSPRFSPDGLSLIVDGVPIGRLSEATDDFSIWSVDLTTHHPERLTKGSHADVLWETKKRE
jgi:TolB protein